MSNQLFRSIEEPIRKHLSYSEMWHGPDNGLIYCWERGREKRIQTPGLAEAAERGELMILAWTGGIEKKLTQEKYGTYQYLATWQGLRDSDLDIPIGKEITIQCTRTLQKVVFTSDKKKLFKGTNQNLASKDLFQESSD